MSPCPEGKDNAKLSSRRGWPVVLGASLVLLGLRLANTLHFELFPDELLYAWIGRHAPLSFCPHPPGVPLLVRAGSALLGRCELGVRLGSLLLSSLTLIPLYLLARQLGGVALGVWTVLAAACVPQYLGFGAIATPDAPQLFFWATALYFTWNALNARSAAWWVAAGLTLGAGLYVKYILVLYYPSLGLCLLLCPSWRRHWRAPGLYLSVALALLVFAPLAAWCDYRDGWSTLRYHLGERQSFLLPSIKSFLIYQGLHAAYVSPLLYAGSLAAMVWAGRKALRGRSPELVFVFAFSAVCYLFFAAVCLVTRRELSREQWDAPAYLAALMALGMMLQKVMQEPQRQPRARKAGLASLAVGAAMSLLILAEGHTGLAGRLLGGEPLFGSLYGWRQLAEETDRRIETLPAGQKPPFLLGDSFRPVLAYDFYGKATAHLYTLDHSSHTNWGLTKLLASQQIAQQWLKNELGHDALFLCEPSARRSSSGSSQRREQKLRRLFGSVEELPSVEVRRAGQLLRQFRMFRCVDLRQLP